MRWGGVIARQYEARAYTPLAGRTTFPLSTCRCKLERMRASWVTRNVCASSACEKRAASSLSLVFTLPPPLGSGALALRMHYLTAAHCRRTQQAERRKLRREHIVAPKVRLRNRGALLGRQSDMFDGRGRVAAADGGGAAGATRPRAVAGRRRRTKGFPLPFKPVQSARRFRFRGRWFGCASGKGPGLRTRRGLSKRFR